MEAGLLSDSEFFTSLECDDFLVFWNFAVNASLLYDRSKARRE